MKEITICNKTYRIECNALTYILYKKIFNKGILQDIRVLQDYLIKQVVISKYAEENNMKDEEKVEFISNSMSEHIDDFIIAITKIAWILIYTADKDIPEYEKWLSTISKLKIDDKWIVEVAEFAVDCFCR